MVSTNSENSKNKFLSIHASITITYLILASLFFMSCGNKQLTQSQQSNLSQSASQEMKGSEEDTITIDDLINKDIDNLEFVNSDGSRLSSTTLPKLQAVGDTTELFKNKMVSQETGSVNENEIVRSAVYKNFVSHNCIKDYPSADKNKFLVSYTSFYSLFHGVGLSGGFRGSFLGDVKNCSANYTSITIYVKYPVDPKLHDGVSHYGWPIEFKQPFRVYLGSGGLDFYHRDLAKGGALERLLQYAAKKVDPSAIKISFRIYKEKSKMFTTSTNSTTSKFFTLENHGVRAFAKFANYDVFGISTPDEGKMLSRYYDNYRQTVIWNVVHSGGASAIRLDSKMTYKKPHPDLKIVRQHDYHIMKRFFRVFVETLHASS
ncbi:MAG: hypothetical protein OXC44_08445 [Proteobacteria bacterium]|nr:hypothetical protein [Pseudomonadota bacterium]